MTWVWFGFAFLIANAAAFGFHCALRRAPRARIVAWLVCSLIIALTPCVTPRDARALRFVSAVVAITLLWKLYDAYRKPALAAVLSASAWAAYLPNWFWFVLSRVPRQQPARRDWLRAAIGAPLMVAAVGLCALLLKLDWTGVPFALQHSAKVAAFAVAMTLIGRTFAALYRRLIGPAMDPIGNVFMPRTPAEFWRRWNRPFRDFFDEYIFRPAGGARRPVTATLIVFAASGLMHEYVFGVATGRVQAWQMLFFMLQGTATAATLRVRPTGRAAVLWWAGTVAFNLTTSAIFVRSVDQVIEFYQR